MAWRWILGLGVLAALLFAGAAAGMRNATCTTDRDLTQTVAGIALRTVETDCDTLTKSVSVSIYVSGKDGEEELLRYDPADDSVPARIAALPDGSIHIHVPHIPASEATILKSRVKDRTLRYTFGP